MTIIPGLYVKNMSIGSIFALNIFNINQAYHERIYQELSEVCICHQP
jgi:hypothetical protein